MLGVEEADGEPAMEGVPDAVKESAEVPDGLLLLHPDADALGLVLAVQQGELEGVALVHGEGDRVTDTLGDTVREPLGEEEEEESGVADCKEDTEEVMLEEDTPEREEEEEGVCEPVTEALAEPRLEAVRNVEGLADTLKVAEELPDSDTVPEGETLAEGVALEEKHAEEEERGVGERLGDGEGDIVLEAVSHVLTVMLLDPHCDAVEDGDREEDAEGEACEEMVGEVVEHREGDALPEEVRGGDCEAVALAQRVLVAELHCEVEGEELCEGDTEFVLEEDRVGEPDAHWVAEPLGNEEKVGGTVAEAQALGIGVAVLHGVEVPEG